MLGAREVNQISFDLETAARDAALDLLEEHRAPLIEIARAVAQELAIRHGRVTSPDVVQELRARGYGDMIDAVDKRFMGAVFRSGNGWERIGFENLGSHRQPISVWRKRGDLLLSEPLANVTEENDEAK